MVVKIIARVDLPLLELKMRVKPFFLRAAAGEMFGHAGDAVQSKLFAL